MIHYIGVGPFCAAAGTLENHGRRAQAFPFDYIFSSLPMIRHIIQDRCNIFLDKQYLIEKGDTTFHSFYCNYIDTPILRKHHEAYEEARQFANKLKERSIFLHHNLFHEETYQAFQRRCDRLMNLIDNNEQIVFFYFNPYINDHTDVFEFADSLREYPSIRVVCMSDTSTEKRVLEHGTNCKVYQGYDPEEMFRDIESL